MMIVPLRIVIELINACIRLFDIIISRFIISLILSYVDGNDFHAHGLVGVIIGNTIYE